MARFGKSYKNSSMWCHHLQPKRLAACSRGQGIVLGAGRCAGPVLTSSELQGEPFLDVISVVGKSQPWLRSRRLSGLGEKGITSGVLGLNLTYRELFPGAEILCSVKQLDHNSGPLQTLRMCTVCVYNTKHFLQPQLAAASGWCGP